MQIGHFGNAADTVYGNPAWTTTMETQFPGLSNVIAVNASPGEDWSTTLQRLLPSLAATYQQVSLMQIQLDRAKAGLPPLTDVAGYGLGVNVGLSAETQKLLMYGGIGLLGFLVVNSVLKHRR